MNISDLEPASDHKVNQWLVEELNLSPYQKEKLYEKEIVRFAPFEFYQRPAKIKVSLLWRLTLIVYPFYIFALICFLPFKWIATGTWGYGSDFIDKFHGKWKRKLGL